MCVCVCARAACTLATILIYSAADAPGDTADEVVAAVPSLFLIPTHLFTKMDTYLSVLHRNFRSNFDRAVPMST